MSTVTQRIESFNSNRDPFYAAIKYGVMRENEFRFFRGSCHLFYEDLFQNNILPASPNTWSCGDLHLENFGSFKADNRLVYFDLNDFDESILAPACWEIVRMLTSILLAFEVLKIDQQEALSAVNLFLKSYSETLANGKALYIEAETATGIVSTFLKKIAERKMKTLVAEHTIVSKDDQLLIRIDKQKLFPIDPALKSKISAHIEQWARVTHPYHFPYAVSDVCFRIAGTGSIGQPRYLLLLRNTESEKKHALVDMKGSQPSSLTPFINITQPAWSSEAERIVAIQQRMQNVSPALLDASLLDGKPYVLKEMQPVEDKIDFKIIRDQYKEIRTVISDMAILTASAQLRSSGRNGSATADELIHFGKNESWKQSLLTYAVNYSAKAKQDFHDFLVSK